MIIEIAGRAYTIKHTQNGAELFKRIVEEKPKILTYDTETTGLHVKADVPFKGAICFSSEVYLFDTTYDILKWFPKWCGEVKKAVMHNAPFDLNMTANIIGEDEALKSNNFLDTQALVLLASESISESRGGIKLGLKLLATKYIDPEANKYEIALKAELKRMESARQKILTAYLKGEGITKKAYNEMKKSPDPLPELVQEIEDAWNEENPKATYADVEDDILYPYLAADVILTQLLYEKVAPVVKERGQLKALKIENDIIPVVTRMARVGMEVDADYLRESELKLVAVIERLYKELWSYTEPLGFKFTSGQHDVVKKYYKAKGIILISSDAAAMEDLDDPESTIISRLRTLEKWLSTYVRKILRDIEYDGRFYSMMKAFKPVSGRFSGDAQQFPKYPLKDEDGSVIFESRRAFKGEWVFQDFSQVELRVAAHWTTFFGYDENLCKAYMPYGCTHFKTGKKYDPTDITMRDSWKELIPAFTWELLDKRMTDAGDDDPRNDAAAVKYGYSVWMEPSTNRAWKQTDLHQATATKAVEFLTGLVKKLEKDKADPLIITSDEWFDREITKVKASIDQYDKKMWRQLGKRANFLLLYQGTVKALMGALKIDNVTATALYNGFEESFPQLKAYAKAITYQMKRKGYCENPFGRRYFLSDPSQFYCIANYMIQGTCAYDLKSKMVRIDNYLLSSGAKTRMVLCVHDEIIFSKVPGEEHHIQMCVDIMEDSSMLNIPLVSEKEITTTFWSAKTAA